MSHSDEDAIRLRNPAQVSASDQMMFRDAHEDFQPDLLPLSRITKPRNAYNFFK